MMCINDLEGIDLKGQYKHDDGHFLNLSLEKCSGRAASGVECESPANVTTWGKEHQILLLYNN